MVNVRYVETPAGVRGVPGNGVLADADGKSGIRQLGAQRQLLLHGGVLSVREMELVLVPNVDGPGIGVDKTPGLVQNAFHKQVKVRHPVEFRSQVGQDFQFLGFGEHQVSSRGAPHPAYCR